MVSYDGSSFDADSTHEASTSGAKEAFSSSPKIGWHSAFGSTLPQRLAITFPTKRKIVKISFAPRQDCAKLDLLNTLRMGAPTEFKIQAKNAPINLTTQGQTVPEDAIWETLGHMKNVAWNQCDSVFVAEIPLENRNFYYSYGILVIASNREIKVTGIAKVKMWETVWQDCFS